MIFSYLRFLLSASLRFLVFSAIVGISLAVVAISFLGIGCWSGGVSSQTYDGSGSPTGERFMVCEQVE
ncbi:MAG: hypothetical protein AAFQ59_17755 [Pseudomonadota bacterium]